MPAAALLALALAGCGGGFNFGGPPAPATDAAATPPPSNAAATPPPSNVAATPPPSSTAAAPAPSSPSWKDKIEGFFSTASAAREARPVTNTQQADVDCPLMDIRQGAATLTIPPPPPDGSNDAMSVKYQGTFVRAARDCKVVGNQLSMDIGVEGRIIVGPAGGPGRVDVPLRIAIVDQSPTTMKTILTKLIRIPVPVNNDNSVTFSHIEDGMAFPLPSSAELDNYIVYIGFDPIGAAEEDRAKLRPAPRSKPKLKPKTSPNAPTG